MAATLACPRRHGAAAAGRACEDSPGTCRAETFYVGGQWASDVTMSVPDHE
jgi:hypothetical protein